MPPSFSLPMSAPFTPPAAEFMKITARFYVLLPKLQANRIGKAANSPYA